MVERTDFELISSYRRTGAVGHFEILVVRHRDQVLRLVVSVLGPDQQADAEDVVQLAFVRVHDRLDQFRGHSAFGTWLYRIAYNLALDHKRTFRRRQRLQRVHLPTRQQDPAAMDTQSGQTELRLSVRRAVERVSEPYQTALRLHYWFEMSVAEIAEIMGVAVGTAKSYLHRGRKRFHHKLDPEGSQ